MSFYTDEQLSMILGAFEAISWYGRFEYHSAAKMKEMDNTWNWLTDVCSLFSKYATTDGLLKRLEKDGLA